MLGPQHVVRLPGLIMVAIAVIGSITIGSDLAEGPVRVERSLFSVSWTTGMDSISSGSGTTNDGESASIVVDLGMENLTTVTFKVAWRDNARISALFPATVTITVIDPNGTARGEDSGTSGASGVSVTVTGLNAPYDLEEMESASEEEAGKELAEQCPPLTNGMGEWEVEVTVQRDFPLSIGQRSVDWEAVCDVSYFYAELGPENPEEE